MTVNPRPLLPRGSVHREGITLGMAIGAIAIALIVGVGIYTLSHHHRVPTAANPPAVTAPAPVQDETTGQLAPPMR
jgi:hypothetical protein